MTTIAKRSKRTIDADIFLLFNLLTSLVYSGMKIYARINPATTETRTGFNRKKTNTPKIINAPIIKILLMSFMSYSIIKLISRGI